MNTNGEENNDRIIDDHYLSNRNKVAEKVKKNIIAAQMRQKKAYDIKHHNPEAFKVGFREGHEKKKVSRW